MNNNTLILIIVVATICLVPGSVIIYNLFLNPGCGPGETILMENYHVNEWGIFKQEYNSNNGTYLIGPMPGTVPIPEVVEEVECKPVIYFHGDGKMRLSVNVTTSAQDVLTLPACTYTGGKIKWNIDIAGDIYDQGDDAKVITSSSEAFEYLFYEGKSDYYQNIMVSVTKLYRNIMFPDGLRINIQNIGNYEMEDIYVICDLNLGGPKKMLHFSELKPSEIINQTQSWDDWINGSDLRGKLKEDLIDRNLTDEEAEDLLNYWVDGDVDENGMKVDKTLLEPDGKETVEILFFISEEEYDHKLPIEFSKEPSSIDRVGISYVFNIPIMRQR